jgi:DNA-binding MarR family transcriptional regulator
MRKIKLYGEPVKDSWLLLHEVSGSLERCEEDLFKQIGMMVQEYQVLKSITFYKTNVTPTKINQILNYDPNYLSYLLKKMEKEGLIKRTKDMVDHRSIRLEITPNGNSIHRKAKKSAEKLPNNLLSVLTRNELSIFIDVLQKLRIKINEYRNLEEHY